jgi:ABC-type transporter Mla MlaB component
MAENFCVHAKKSSDRGLALKLSGDFDESSARRLIDVLEETVQETFTVAIDTDCLKSVDPFGLDVFLPRMSLLNDTRADIEAAGRFTGVFREA